MTPAGRVFYGIETATVRAHIEAMPVLKPDLAWRIGSMARGVGPDPADPDLTKRRIRQAYPQGMPIQHWPIGWYVALTPVLAPRIDLA